MSFCFKVKKQISLVFIHFLFGWCRIINVLVKKIHLSLSIGLKYSLHFNISEMLHTKHLYVTKSIISSALSFSHSNLNNDSCTLWKYKRRLCLLGTRRHITLHLPMHICNAHRHTHTPEYHMNFTASLLLLSWCSLPRHPVPALTWPLTLCSPQGQTDAAPAKGGPSEPRSDSTWVLDSENPLYLFDSTHLPCFHPTNHEHTIQNCCI